MIVPHCTRFIMVQTAFGVNIGASARAMKTMGFTDLALVEPFDQRVLRRKKTQNGASGAVGILETARLFDTVAEAIEGFDIVCATGMAHSMYYERAPRVYQEPRNFFHEMIRKWKSSPDTSTPIKIAIVFGNEKYGIRNEDMDLCDERVLSIPTNPEFGSLNLASAVQLIAYDWRQAIGGFDADTASLQDRE